jgi:hypothetical protein
LLRSGSFGRVALTMSALPMILLDQRSLPTAGAGGEEHAIGGFETRTRDLTMEHGELMAQHEDLDILGTIAAGLEPQPISEAMAIVLEGRGAAEFTAAAVRGMLPMIEASSSSRSVGFTSVWAREP